MNISQPWEEVSQLEKVCFPEATKNYFYTELDQIYG